MQKRPLAVVSNPSGVPIPNARVTVTAYPSGALASLFSDSAGTVPLANPMTANSQGEYSYYAANGRYSEAFSAAGFRVETDTDCVLLNDPADSITTTPTTISGTGLTSSMSLPVASTPGGTFSVTLAGTLTDLTAIVQDASSGTPIGVVHYPEGNGKRFIRPTTTTAIKLNVVTFIGSSATAVLGV